MTSPERGDANLENVDSDRSEYRQRYLFIKNRLEELKAQHGRAPPDPEPMGIECDPSWGPVGSLARRTLGAAAVARLVEWDEQLALLNRQRARMDGTMQRSSESQQFRRTPEAEATWQRDAL